MIGTSKRTLLIEKSDKTGRPVGGGIVLSSMVALPASVAFLPAVAPVPAVPAALVVWPSASVFNPMLFPLSAVWGRSYYIELTL